jgi:hypothetical protein
MRRHVSQPDNVAIILLANSDQTLDIFSQSKLGNQWDTLQKATNIIKIAQIGALRMQKS